MQLGERFGTGITTKQWIMGAALEDLLPPRPCKTVAFLSSLPQSSNEYLSVSKVCGSVTLQTQPKSEWQHSLHGFQPPVEKVDMSHSTEPWPVQRPEGSTWKSTGASQRRLLVVGVYGVLSSELQ
ncbi:hypothetical protein llap_4165 [Limosa lapponica baueri]|uniref:Uncharacterized protein n=1 Tax=Limosa lapponica baueri TaxID=1758121 RepID=A0A2I0UHI7_LIMLA|nr:hypothetical protein llap_4165 [Limosa lapponica baueri]